MTYDSVAVVSQVAALALFFAMFVGVLIYTFWPGNRKRFERAARLPLSDADGNDIGRPL